MSLSEVKNVDSGLAKLKAVYHTSLFFQPTKHRLILLICSFPLIISGCGQESWPWERKVRKTWTFFLSKPGFLVQPGCGIICVWQSGGLHFREEKSASWLFHALNSSLGLNEKD